MRILIIGSGAIGGFIGARLVEKKIDVTFLVRPERKIQLMTLGLHLNSQFGRFRQPVSAITVDEIDGVFDVVVIATCAHRYEEALLLAASAIGPATVVVPMIEGASHLARIPGADGPRLIGAVLEARVSIDADGHISQRPPAAELHIGALRPVDGTLAAGLANVFAGRGLNVIESNRVRAKSWERYSFVCAAIATSVLMRRPLRDAVRFAHGPNTFNHALKECAKIGQMAAFKPDPVKVDEYQRAASLVGVPVDPPPRIEDGGRASDECLYLLGQMVAVARQVGVHAFHLEQAWTAAKQLTGMSSSAADVPLMRASGGGRG